MSKANARRPDLSAIARVGRRCGPAPNPTTHSRSTARRTARRLDRDAADAARVGRIVNSPRRRAGARTHCPTRTQHPERSFTLPHTPKVVRRARANARINLQGEEGSIPKDYPAISAGATSAGSLAPVRFNASLERAELEAETAPTSGGWISPLSRAWAGGAGLRTTQRLDRDATRGAQPGDSITMLRPRRVWAGAPSSPRRRAGARAHCR